MDRHEHIGKGAIGRRGFRNLMTDPRLATVPKFLETPKDETLELDRKNLATLRGSRPPLPAGEGRLRRNALSSAHNTSSSWPAPSP